MPPETSPPTLKLNVGRSALAHNWRTLDRLSGSARAGAAVKANCYGLGVDRCMPTLVEAGARDFYVAHWQEVPPLLTHVAPEQVSVLHGVLSTQEAACARSIGVRPVINSVTQAKLWSESGGGACDLMIDTGINRLGVAAEELAASEIQSLDVHTLMSHLACADEQSTMNARQLSLFQECLGAVAHKDSSLANSAGIALGPEYGFGLTRPGLSLYGGVPREELAQDIRQVASVSAAIIQTRMIEPGESVGYNAKFVAKRDMKVGVVSLGYADGILRGWGEGNAAFEHEGQALAILGKISMDMIVVDLSNAPPLTEGDWVELPYHLPNAAQKSGLSQYELLTILGHRFG
ncbi:alanine racemase [Qipengyuania sp. DGS5-3]|uniref:alanine racemase n=1 Tax=Qipengyuania sp. DGS5-3 TaxID=3349632 RepID=UPI0036D28238